MMTPRSSEPAELDLRVVIRRIVVRMQSPASATPRATDETTGSLLAAVRDAVGPRRSSQ